MERKSLGLIGGAGAALALTLAAKTASAERFPVERTEPREHLAEILSIDGPSIVWRKIDDTRKSAKVTASPGSPVNVQVGCPSDWKLSVGAEPPVTAEHGVAHSTLPGTGVHNAALFAPVRVGETRTARLGCVKMEPGSDGTPGTADDVAGDKEELAIEVTAVAGSPADTDDSFVYRDEALLDSAGAGMPVEVSGSVLAVDGDVGGLVSAKVDPVAKGLAGRVPVGVTYRVGRAHEEVTGLDGSEKEASGLTHCGFVGGGWSPILAQQTVDVRLEVEGAMGICRADEIETGPGTSIPAVTDVAGRLGFGVQIGGRNLAVRAGVDTVLSDQEALQSVSPNVGIVGRF
jgi:hypothetical protein